jgi:hypothetical protein
MTHEYCANERLPALTPQTGFFPSRASTRDDDDPPRAAELFREAGLALAVPLVLAFLIALGTAGSVP